MGGVTDGDLQSGGLGRSLNSPGQVPRLSLVSYRTVPYHKRYLKVLWFFDLVSLFCSLPSLFLFYFVIFIRRTVAPTRLVSATCTPDGGPERPVLRLKSSIPNVVPVRFKELKVNRKHKVKPGFFFLFPFSL